MTPSITGRIAKDTRIRLQSSTHSPERVEHYCRLVERIEREILPHEVIVSNQYTKWFEKGEFDLIDIRHFLTQFSVFSHFLLWPSC